MIDTHCHLYTKEFDPDIDLVIERAKMEGVTKFYMPAIDKSCTERMTVLEQKFPQDCFSMAGLHPCSVNENVEEELAHVKHLLQQRKFSAIGETGLDFYWDKTFTDLQYMALEVQIELALQYNLPLVLHTRNATQETINVIQKYSHTNL
ncbi:MAG: TatD family hydrolase, partial [Ferruginibacter sp.]